MSYNRCLCYRNLDPPAGEFDRTVNEAGTEVVVPGTYHTVEASPVGPFETVKSIYFGMLNGGGVIFFVFIAYASIGLMISTGAFNGLVAGLLKILKGKTRALSSLSSSLCWVSPPLP